MLSAPSLSGENVVVVDDDGDAFNLSQLREIFLAPANLSSTLIIISALSLLWLFLFSKHTHTQRQTTTLYVRWEIECQAPQLNNFALFFFSLPLPFRFSRFSFPLGSRRQINMGANKCCLCWNIYGTIYWPNVCEKSFSFGFSFFQEGGNERAAKWFN